MSAFTRRGFIGLLLAGPAAFAAALRRRRYRWKAAQDGRMYPRVHKPKTLRVRFTHSRFAFVYRDGRAWYPAIPGGRREVARSVHQSWHHDDTYVRCDDGTLWYQPEGGKMWTRVEGRVRG